MTQAILYIHGQGGNPQEAEQYRAICPDLDLIGVEYPQQYPWDALPVIQAAYEEARRTHSQIWLLANSIGAYFGMLALQDRPIEKAPADFTGPGYGASDSGYDVLGRRI